VPLRAVLAPADLLVLSKAIERDLANPGPFNHWYRSDGGGRFYGNMRLWQRDARLREFCCTSALPGIARAVLKSTKLNLFYDQLFLKEPDTPNPTRWHNDLPYWPIRGRQILSIWVALDHTTLDSGALRFIRGSHLWNRMFQPEVFGEVEKTRRYVRNPDYEPVPDIDGHEGNYDIVSWDLDPGDVYVFHALTVHGSSGNFTRRRRRGYVVRYAGDDVVYDTRMGTNEYLLNRKLRDGDPLDSRLYPLIDDG
ncbi:phytanoyl-CoA dioxygenase family protein, partial [Pseudomonadota bacterium]